MYNQYLAKILPIPIVDIEVSKNDNYKYRVTTYASVLNESGTQNRIAIRLKNNKRIKSFDGWYFMQNEPFYKQAIIEFKRG